jgi:parvulin-like peptidyl-prolyl isomerase
MRIILAMLVSAGIVASTISAQADDGSTVVATVNGAVLTRAELNQEISKLLPMERRYHGGIAEEKMKPIEKKAMDTLVNMELQYQYALSQGLKLDTRELELEKGKLEANYPDRESYLDAVKKGGFTETGMQRFITRNVISQKIKSREVDEKISVTDAQVLEYYTQNKSKYMKPEEYRASLILVKVPPSAKAEEKPTYRKKIEDLQQQLKEGVDFEMLAAKFSEDMTRIKGGDLGTFHAGQSDDPEFDAQITKMNVGDVSGILSSLKGYYIVKLTDKRAPRQIPFDEVKEKIKKLLIERQRDNLFTTWMEALKKKAVITFPSPDSKDKGPKS